MGGRQVCGPESKIWMGSVEGFASVPGYLVGLVLVAYLCVFCRDGRAQQAGGPNSNTTHAPIKSFDVASVRPNVKNDGRWHMIFTDDGYSATGVTAKQLVQDAYGIYEDARLFGLSGWAVNERYDIEAKVDTSEASEFAALSAEQKRLLLQDLLKRRFKLVDRREVRVNSAFVLVQSNKGAKMAEASPAASAADPHDRAFFSRMRPGQVTAEHCTAGQLAHLLALDLNQPVQDETHLPGDYAFSLDWDPDYDKVDRAESMNSGSGDTRPVGASLFTALREQLGLELKAKKIPVDVLVVDSIERPSGN